VGGEQLLVREPVEWADECEQREREAEPEERGAIPSGDVGAASAAEAPRRLCEQQSGEAG
jgi:hypothetical protein